MNDSSNRVMEVFAGPIQLSANERSAYLEDACGSDEELHQRVERLLKAHDQVGHFLEQPAPKAVPQASAGQKPGDRIGRYKLLQQIGEGGCGGVYMAEQEQPVRRRVALKVLESGDLGKDWRDWIIAHALLTEARTLIEGGAAPRANSIKP